MNPKKFLILVLIVLILSGCQESTVISTPLSTTEPTVVGSLQPTTMSNSIQTREEAEDGESFAIYLVADLRFPHLTLSIGRWKHCHWLKNPSYRLRIS